MLRNTVCRVIACAVVISSVSFAEDLELKKRIKDLNADSADHWIYNDIAAGLREAKRTGKPLLVTFRCVPCKACLGFDAEVADGNEQIKELAKARFVCVRQVEMKGVDLTQFQFDHDLNWAAMFLNADGTVYARYGTQSAEGPDAFNSTKGLVSTMQRVLALHDAYPKNADLFAGKKPERKKWRTAREMPTLNPSIQVSGQTTRSNCVHCHNIHDAENELLQKQGKMSEEALWRYPLPENLGLKIRVIDGRTIESVRVDSAAQRGGVQSGKTIETANGQAISSIADLQWVLHHLPGTGQAKVELTFSDGSRASISLADGWKRTDISWRGSMWALSPRLRVWSPPVSNEVRRDIGVAENEGALQVKWINRDKPGGRAALKAGLRNGDIIVKLAGKPIPNAHNTFNTFIKLNYSVGQSLDLTVIRGGKAKQIAVPLVE